MRTFRPVVDLGARSQSPTALAAGEQGLILAWIDAAQGDIRVATSPDGETWSEPVRTGLRAERGLGVIWHEGRYWLIRYTGRSMFDVLSSRDGTDWHREGPVTAASDHLPLLIVLDGELHVAWVDHGGAQLLASRVDGSSTQRPTVIYEGMISEPSLLVDDDGLHLAWVDHATNMIHLVDRPARGWRVRTIVHERVEGTAKLVGLNQELFLAWVRADGSNVIHLHESPDRSIVEGQHVFRGDLQGHPTALSTQHHTPYPYLGVVVVANDGKLPKGQTDVTLTAALDATLTEVAKYWAEASFGKVQITHDVHPTVVSLPKAMSSYLVRARPKLIEGNGATYPIAFTGGRTLDLVASANFAVTVTFPNASLSLQDVIAAINTAIDAAGYVGKDAAKPLAAKSDIGQIRIQTSAQVDPGDPLDVTGGTALDLLGLDAANRVVYEGNTVQTDHLGLMLRDALRTVAQTKPDPAAFLRSYYGVVVSLASDLGWYAIRANASLGPDDVDVLLGEKDFRIASYFATSLDANDVHAHEVGHNLDLPDLYEEGTRNVGAELGLWDGMDSNSFSHPSAWAKSYRSAKDAPAARWIDGSHVTTIDGTNQSVEVLLAPLESQLPTANPYAHSHPGVPLTHAVKVELDPGHAYFVENRQRGPYDDPHFGHVAFSTHLPGDGIVITEAVDDLSVVNFSRASAVLVHPYGVDVADVPESAIDDVEAAGTLAQKQAVIDAYVPDEIPQYIADKVARAKDRPEIDWILRSYRDQQIRDFYPVDTPAEDVLVYQLPDGEGEIRVKLLEVLGTSRPHVYKVRVSCGRTRSSFDLSIHRWQDPPPYESVDIWIDSAENGWDTYEHSDATKNPTVVGNPVLNGDRPWVGVDNRVMARVWNQGDIAQNNVRVEFLEVVPPGQSAGYPFATDHINIPAGGSEIATGIWRPRAVPASEHGCVMVQVEYRPWNMALQEIGELNANNNSAQENITDFYLEKASPYSTIELPFEFASPRPEQSEMKLRARGLEPGWTLSVEPYRFWLLPGERIQGTLVLSAADSVPLQDPREGTAAPVVSLEAMTRIGCTWEPVGGFTMVAHTVRKSTLDVLLDPTGTGVHVSIHASDPAGPIADANVAIRLVLDDERTVSVMRATTDSTGDVHEFVHIDWNSLGSGAALKLEVRLSPQGQSGPASTVVPLPPTP